MIIKGLILSDAEKAILNYEDIEFKQTKKGVSLSADDFNYIVGCYVGVHKNAYLKSVARPFFEKATENQLQRALN